MRPRRFPRKPIDLSPSRQTITYTEPQTRNTGGPIPRSHMIVTQYVMRLPHNRLRQLDNEGERE